MPLWFAFAGVKPPRKPKFSSLSSDLTWDSILSAAVLIVLAFLSSPGFCIHYPALAGSSAPEVEIVTSRAATCGVMILYLITLLPFASSGRAELQHVYGERPGVDHSLRPRLAYSIYPLLYYVGRRVGWNLILAVSFILSGRFPLAEPGDSETPTSQALSPWCRFFLLFMDPGLCVSREM